MLCHNEHKHQTDDREIALANLQTKLSKFMYQSQPWYKYSEHEPVTTISRGFISFDGLSHHSGIEHP